MAKVPTLGPTVFQNLQASPAAFGAAQGRAAQVGGEALQDIGGLLVNREIQRRQDENEIAHKQGVIAINEIVNRHELDYFDKNAGDATNTLDDALLNVNIEIDEYLVSQENIKVQESLGLYASAEKVDIVDRYNKHASTQRKIQKALTNKAVEASIATRITNDPHNTSRNEEFMLDIDVIKNNEMDDLGILPIFGVSAAESQRNSEARKSIIQEAQGIALEDAVINVLINEGPDAAAIYMESALIQLNMPTAQQDELKKRILAAKGTAQAVSVQEANTLTKLAATEGNYSSVEFDRIIKEITPCAEAGKISCMNARDKLVFEYGIKEKVEFFNTLSIREQGDIADGIVQRKEFDTIGNLQLASRLKEEFARNQIAIKENRGLELWNRHHAEDGNELQNINFDDSSESFWAQMETRKIQTAQATAALGQDVSPFRPEEAQELARRMLGDKSATGQIEPLEKTISNMRVLQQVFGSQVASRIGDQLSDEQGGLFIAFMQADNDPAGTTEILQGFRLMRENELKTINSLIKPEEELKMGNFGNRTVIIGDAVPGYFTQATRGIQRDLDDAAGAIAYLRTPTGEKIDKDTYEQAVKDVLLIIPLNKILGDDNTVTRPHSSVRTREQWDALTEQITDNIIANTKTGIPLYVKGENGKNIHVTIENLQKGYIHPKSIDFSGRYVFADNEGRVLYTSFIDEQGQEQRAPYVLNIREMIENGILDVENKFVPQNVPSLQSPPPQPEGRTFGDVSNVVSDTESSMMRLYSTSRSIDSVIEVFKFEENSILAGRTNGIWKAHKDPKGHVTLGYGHKLTKEELDSGEIEIGGIFYNIKAGEITDDLADQLLQEDMVKHTEFVANMLERWDELSAARKAAVAQIAFLVGSGGVKKFTKTLGAVDDLNFDRAADELAKNHRLTSSGRLSRMVDMLRDGVF